MSKSCYVSYEIRVHLENSERNLRVQGPGGYRSGNSGHEYLSCKQVKVKGEGEERYATLQLSLSN